jgi:hypothetical protein
MKILYYVEHQNKTKVVDLNTLQCLRKSNPKIKILFWIKKGD